jgi:cobalt-zinc-cadmium efflux system outer membrane protein
MRMLSGRTIVNAPLAVLVVALTGAFGAQEPKPKDQPAYYAKDPQLQQFIREALERNPAVRQAFSRYRAASQRPAQAGSLPDPVVGITQYVRTPETRVGPQTTMATVSQQFPWFGKLADREGIALKQAAATGEMYEAQKAEVVRQVKLAFYNLAYVDRALAITREDLSVLQHYEDLAQARYSQGVGLQQAVIKLQAEITRDQNRLDHLQIRRTDAEAALNAMVDRPPATPIPVLPLPRRPPVVIRYDDLYARGRENRPEIRAALLQIESEEKRVDLAHRNYWPDVTISGGFVNVNQISDLAGMAAPPEDNGKNIYSASVSLNLPIRRRKYDAALIEATEDKIAAQEGYRNSVNQMEASVRATGFQIQTLAEQIDLFEHTLIPQSQQALQSSETGYSTGTIGVLDLLDSERVLLDVRLGLAQLESDYWKSLAEMERATGAPFPEVKP